MTTRTSKVASPPTIVDVARAAGVSIKTVSRVINKESGVTDATRSKVLGAVTRLGYQRNVFARGLRASSSLVLGLLYENPQGDYPADILYGALAESRRRGYHLAVEVLRGEDVVEQIHRFLSEARLDGVLMTPPVCDDPRVLSALATFAVPFVRISPRDPLPSECYIAIDDVQAGYDAARYLVTLGHRRIGFVKGLADHAATQFRLKGYRTALADADIPLDPQLVVDGDFSFGSGRSAARTLLDLATPVTAILACNDETAAGVLSFAHDRGIAVPGSLSVAGFDGGTVSKVVWPRLTTVRQPIRRLGETAVANLTGDIPGEKADPPPTGPIILPHELVVGASTAVRAPGALVCQEDAATGPPTRGPDAG